MPVMAIAFGGPFDGQEFHIPAHAKEWVVPIPAPPNDTVGDWIRRGKPDKTYAYRVGIIRNAYGYRMLTFLYQRTCNRKEAEIRAIAHVLEKEKEQEEKDAS